MTSAHKPAEKIKVMLSSCLNFELNHEKKCHIIKTSSNPIRISREL